MIVVIDANNGLLRAGWLAGVEKLTTGHAIPELISTLPSIPCSNLLGHINRLLPSILPKFLRPLIDRMCHPMDSIGATARHYTLKVD
jgi:hypothetical protein